MSLYSEEQLKENINGFDRQMLYEIRNLLIEINKKLSNGSEEIKSVEEPIEELEKKKYFCDKCNTTYDNFGKYSACRRKHKKEGG